MYVNFFFFQAEDGIRDYKVTGVQTCALPILISRLGIARKFQVPGIYPTLAVAENVEIPLLSRHGTARPWSMLRAEARTAERLHGLLARFKLRARAAGAAGALAHGPKQRLEIATRMARGARMTLGH